MIKKIVDSIEHVFVDEECRHDEVTARVLHHFPLEKIVWQKEDSSYKGKLTAYQIGQSKKNLHLTRFKGHFFKRCPGASQKKALTCCNYYVLNLGLQCNMDCSYCYLQSYLNTDRMTIYTNGHDAIAEMEETAKSYPDHPYRVGTGEVIDSLSLDALTLYSRDLIEFGRKYPKWSIEFKTKSNQVDQFINQPHAGNILISWSVNPQYVIESEEHKTASLEQRIAAAKKCRDNGFPIAFHIDPIIYHPEWKKNYSELVEILCSHFSSDDIQSFSMGTLRFQAEQRPIIRQRFGAKSLVARAEMLPSEGGKLRYDTRLRTDMYQYIRGEIQRQNSKHMSYVCMETPENWIRSFSSLPKSDPALETLFKPLPQPIRATSNTPYTE